MQEVMKYVLAFAADGAGREGVPLGEPVPLLVNQHREPPGGADDLVRLALSLGPAQVAVAAKDPGFEPSAVARMEACGAKVGKERNELAVCGLAQGDPELGVIPVAERQSAFSRIEL